MRRAVAVLVFLLTASAAARAEPVHIVAFGDSATAGYLVPHDQAYPAQLQRALRAKGHDVAVTNAGISGDTTAGALRRFDQAITPGTKIAIVEFGTNDLRLRVPPAKIRANLTKIVRTLQARHIAVLLAGLGSLDLSDVAPRQSRALRAMDIAAGQVPRPRRRAFQCRRLCDRGRTHAAAGGRDGEGAREVTPPGSPRSPHSPFRGGISAFHAFFTQRPLSSGCQ
jgi:GDSL-like Lipase/Acylhydrolase family